MISRTTRKNLSDIALCLGLTEHLKSKYKGKHVLASIARVEKEGHKLLNLWPGKLSLKEVETITARFERLAPYLDKKAAPVYSSASLAIISDAKIHWKGEKRKQAEIFETRLFSLHKKIDRKFDKLDFSEDNQADNTAKAWKNL